MELDIKYRAMIESSPDAMVVFDVDGVISDVNEETGRLTGYHRDELINSSFKDYFTDPKRVQDGIDVIFSEGVVRDYGLIMVSKEGKKIHVSYNAAVYKDSLGVVEGVFATARDISERKRAEERFMTLYGLLSRVDRSFDDLLDFTADEVAKILDPDMCFITLLEGDSLVFKVLRGEFKGWIEKDMAVNVNETICGIVIRTKKTVMISDLRDDEVSQKYPYLIEHGIRSYVGVPLVDRENRVLGTTCVLNNEPRVYSKADLELLSIFACRVSLAIEKTKVDDELVGAKTRLQERAVELQKLIADLKESEEKYKAIFETANDVIVSLDLHGNIIAVNHKFEEISGYNREKVIGMNIINLTMFPPKSLAVLMKNFAGRMAGLNIPPYNVELVKKDGDLQTIEINARLMKKDGKTVGDLVILRDITEKQIAEKKLKEKVVELERFNKMMIGRELKMRELKDRIKKLEGK